MASAPDASARRMNEALSSFSDYQYSWNQRGQVPIASATSAIGRDAWVEST